jgi:Glycosyl hydrolase family 26
MEGFMMRFSCVLAATVGVVGLCLVPAAQAGASPAHVVAQTTLPSVPWGIAYVNDGVDSTGDIVTADIAKTVSDDGGVTPPLVDVFNNMLEGSSGQNDPTFPAPQAQAVVTAGSTPMLTTQWDGTLTNITSGADDSILTTWAKAAHKFGHKLLLRPWRELNGAWYPWGVPNVGAAEYVAAWQHAYNIIHPIAPNVLWVWNINTSGQNDYTAAYPGDNYVDYISFDSYVGNNSTNWSTTNWTLTQSTYSNLTSLGSGTKPIMVPEFSIYTNSPGLTDTKRAAWITNTFADAASKQPRVVSMDWFNGTSGGVAAFDAPGWPLSQAAFGNAVDNPPYSG